MPRKGRGTELVLKELESLTLRNQAEIKSPDYIIDVVTGINREVDISIRHKIGTHEFLTVIECRDRKGKEDVTWIEQIVTKTKDIKANKVLAVSTSGFTNPAKEKAKHENIILRTLRDFKAEEIIEWNELNIIKIINQKFNIIDVVIKLGLDENKGKRKKIDFQIQSDENRFKNDLGEAYSLDDIVNMTNNKHDDYLFKDLNEGNPPVLKKIKIVPSNKMLFEFDEINYNIKYICIELECWIESIEQVSPTKTLRYEQNGNSILDKVDYKFPSLDKELFMSFTRDPETGNRTVRGNIPIKKEK